MSKQLFSLDAPDNVTDAKVGQMRQRIISAFKIAYGYRNEIPDPNGTGPIPQRRLVPNPESAAQFTKRMYRQFTLEVIKHAEAQEAQEAAKIAAIEKVDAEMELE